MPDDLSTLKDDMIAFIEGHGMRRFSGFVSDDDVQCVMWDAAGNPDGWKDFVELAKSSSAAFLTMHAWTLDREDLDSMVERLRNAHYASGEDVEEARWLRTHIGKTGFIQLGWAYQGTMFLYEAAAEWYAGYQHFVDLAEDFGGLAIDDSDPDDEH